MLWLLWTHQFLAETVQENGNRWQPVFVSTLCNLLSHTQAHLGGIGAAAHGLASDAQWQRVLHLHWLLQRKRASTA